MSALTVTLGADISKLKHGMASASALVASTAKRIRAVATSGMTAIAGAVGVAGAGAFATKLTLMGEAGMTADARIRSIANSMGLFGAGADGVADRIAKLAEATELQTGMDRNQIKLTAAKLLTFKQIAKTAGEVGGAFDRATKAAVDLAAAGFGDAAQNATQLGKALNDPITGMQSLRRAGITFSEAEKEKIAGLVKSNKLLEAQKFMLDAIEQQVGGAGAATADASAQIKASLSQGFEAVGRPLAKALADFAPKFLKFIADIKPKLVEASQFLVAVFSSGQATQLVWQSFKLGFATAVNFLWATLRATISAIGQYFAEMFKIAIMWFEILTTADFWKGMGNALIGIALSFVGFLQKGLAEALELARPLASLFGKGKKIDSAQGTLRESAGMLDEMASERYGKASDQLGPAAQRISDQYAEAGRNIADRYAKQFRETADLIDTKGMVADFGNVVKDIKASIPKPEDIRNIPAGPTGQDDESPAQAATRIAPIVTSLGKVGGGGYATGALDAQRENNRLTGETNSLLKDLTKKVENLGGKPQAAFG